MSLNFKIFAILVFLFGFSQEVQSKKIKRKFNFNAERSALNTPCVTGNGDLLSLIGVHSDCEEADDLVALFSRTYPKGFDINGKLNRSSLNLYFLESLFILHEEKISNLEQGQVLDVFFMDIDSDNQVNLKEDIALFRFFYFNPFKKVRYRKKDDTLLAKGFGYSRPEGTDQIGTLEVMENNDEQLVFSFNLKFDNVTRARIENRYCDFKKNGKFDGVVSCQQYQYFKDTRKQSKFNKPLVIKGQFTYNKTE
jgi:hypothetical protein